MKEERRRLEVRAGSTKFCLPWPVPLGDTLSRETGRGRQGGREGEMLDYFLGLLDTWPLLLKHALDHIIQNYLHMSQFKSLKPTTRPCVSLKHAPYQLSAYQKSAYIKLYRIPSVQASDLWTTTNGLQQLN